MKTLSVRFFTFLLCAALLILCLISFGVTYSAAQAPLLPQQETASVVVYIQEALGVKIIGILGWCLVGIGFLGVALTVALSGRPKKKGRSLYYSPAGPHRSSRYSSNAFKTSYRYRKHIERRY